jgi:hypothetical protein
VEWGDRLEYVQGESGQPVAGWEYGDGYRVRDAEGRRWGECARAVGVPVYVVAAPRHADGWVQLVNRRMLLDAESVAVDGGGDKGGSEPGADVAAVPVVPAEPAAVVGAEDAAADEVDAQGAGDDDAHDELEEELRRRVAVIFERLAANSALAMRSDLWAVVLPWLEHVATDVDGGLCGIWSGCEEWLQLRERRAADGASRSGIRWAFVLALCAACDAQDVDVAGPLVDVEGILGIE